MKPESVTIERIYIFDFFNPRANNTGMVTECVARNAWGNAVAFGDTKAECIKDARQRGYKIS